MTSILLDGLPRSKILFFDEVGFLFEDCKTHGNQVHQCNVFKAWIEVGEHYQEYDVSHVPFSRQDNAGDWCNSPEVKI